MAADGDDVEGDLDAEDDAAACGLHGCEDEDNGSGALEGIPVDV